MSIPAEELESVLDVRIRAIEVILAEYKRGNDYIRGRFCPMEVRELRGSRWLLGELLERVRGGDDLGWAYR